MTDEEFIVNMIGFVVGILLAFVSGYFIGRGLKLWRDE